jgi:AraC-like DNA-binding protein
MENFQNQFVLALIAYAVRRNVDPNRLCELSGIKYTWLTQTGAKPLTALQVNNLWKNVSHLTNDPLFGLHFGESMQIAALGVVGQIIQTSATVGDALTNACALTGLITDMFSMKVQHAKNNFKVVVSFDQAKAAAYPYTFRNMADYLMVFVMHELNGLLIGKIQPTATKFPYPVTHVGEYSRIFECVVSNKQSSELSLEFPARILVIPVLSANYELQNYLLQKINGLTKNGESHSLHAKVYNHLLNNSYLHALSLKSVAANFNLSPRNLQRKLKEEGVGYLDIVDEVRKTLAENYLKSAHYSIKDISHILGYNEPSAFLRAFKRWTGKTPKQFVATK